MDEKTSQNRVVVTDEMGEVIRIKSDAEIVKENQELEDALRPKIPPAPPLPQPPTLDLDVLAKLKMMQKAKEEVPMEIEQLKDRSLNFGVVGLGAAGSRLAEVFAEFGYEACVFNTASQDLQFISLPSSRKVLLPFALGGAGKELDNGRQAVEQNAELILAKLNEVFNERQEMLILAVSGAGGTGSGGAESILGLMNTLQRPLGVIFVLPMETEDSLSKHNSVVTLSKLAKLASTDVISTLIISDNSKIEQIYPGLSKAEFWNTANHAIVEPLHLFNHLSAQPTKFDSLDPMDFSRVFTCGDCTVYGVLETSDYMETTKLAEMAMDLEGGLLASGFNLKETRFVGFMITGNEKTLSRLPNVNISYCSHLISEVCNSPKIAHGIYQIDLPEDVVRLYIMLSGLGLPYSRIDSLQKEAEAQMAIAKEKENTRAEKMSVDYGTNVAGTQATEIHRLISQKKTGFGKLTATANAGKKIIDHRKR
jgi:cell division GTPase FtsZ